MSTKRSSSTFKSNYKLKKSREINTRKFDGVSVDNFIEKYFSILRKDDQGTLNRILRTKGEGMITSEEKQKDFIAMLQNPLTSFVIREILLIGALYHYGVSLPIGKDELEALTKIAMVYEKYPSKAISFLLVNNILNVNDQEGIITGDKIIDKNINIAGYKIYLEKIRAWNISKREGMVEEIVKEEKEAMGKKRKLAKKIKEKITPEYIKKIKKWFPPEQFLNDLISLHNIQEIEAKYDFQEINRKEVEEIIKKAEKLFEHKEEAFEKLARAKKKAVEKKIAEPRLGGDFLILDELMKEKVKIEDTKLFDIVNLNSTNPTLVFTKWGDDVFDSYARIIRNILDDPIEINIFLQDSINFLPFLE